MPTRTPYRLRRLVSRTLKYLSKSTSAARLDHEKQRSSPQGQPKRSPQLPRLRQQPEADEQITFPPPTHIDKHGPRQTHPRTAATISQLMLATVLPSYCHLCRATCDDLLCSLCSASMPTHHQTHLTCAICDIGLTTTQHSEAMEVFCPECLQTLPSFSRIICGYRFENPLTLLINRLKHGKEHFWARLLSAKLIDRINEEYAVAPLPELIVPTPTHWLTLIRRGFNQSELIAHELSSALGIPLEPCLRKNFKTKEQQGLGREERLKNLKGSFSCDINLDGKYVVIVDDVVTTGATAEQLSQCLIDQGACRVDVWAIARTPKPQ